METVKRLFISLLVLLGCSAGAWAIEQDTDGYYLIGSVQDWKDFAELVNNGTNTAANARMTADIDLGDDQTMVGDGYYFVDNNQRPFKGIFDGQGHTLTIHYVTAEVVKKYSAAGIAEPQYFGCAPFGYVWGGTIRNLRTAGTITATHEGVAGIVAYTYNNPLIENCRSSVDITFTDNHRGAGGITYFNYGNQLTINNCLFDGTITGGSNATGSAGFVVYRYENATGDIYIKNSLMAGTFVNLGPNDCCTFVRYSDHAQITNSYYTTALGTVQGTQATAEQLADGTIAYKLQANREDLVWGQRIGIDPEPVLTNDESYRVYKCINGGYTNDPDLAYPGLQQDADGNYLIGSVLDWQEFAELVNSGTNTAANAKMTADVDLGDDQTKIGIVDRRFYSGTFDGQGHTLTINYTHDAANVNAPFPDINNATIKNIHIAGTINSLDSQPAPIGLSRGTCTVKNMWSSLEITSSPKGSKWQESSGIVGLVISGTLTISDCVFTGSNTSSGSYNGCFVGYINSGNAIITNCLSLGEFNYTGSSPGFRGSHNNCYVYQFPTSYPNGVSHISDSDISDGTITTALQADRSEEIWVQDPVLGIPMLKIFANEETEQPSEALNGVFTINASGEKVSFAKGNLQKIGSTYQFAEHQYDYFGTNQSDTHRDMYAFLDYSNPDNGESWSMLSWEEWKYLFATRSVTNTLSDGARYTMATLGGTYKGLIIFPDYYTHPEGTDFTPGVFDSNSNYTAKVSLEGWAMMEAAGCVFLPAAGWCSAGIDWYGVGEEVGYMSSTPTGSKYYSPYFTPEGVYLDEISRQITWTSIRLVMRLQPLTYTVPASGVGTFSSEVNIHLPEGLNAHYCKTYYAERSAISVEDISSGVVPANTGVLLSGTPGETFNLYRTHETADELEGNALVAVTEPTHINATEGDYTNFMMSGGKFIRIADESEDVKMPANRAYLPLLTADISGSNAKEIMLLWDDKEATGIERMRNVENEIMRKGNIYNLNGQKLSSPLKGINIINGRKVIVK